MTLDLFATSYVRWIVYLLLADWMLGLLVALAKNKFKLHLCAHYLHDGVLPYLFVFVVISAVASAQTGLNWLVPLTFVLIAATLVGNILANLGKLGLPVPSQLKKVE